MGTNKVYEVTFVKNVTYERKQIIEVNNELNLSEEQIKSELRSIDEGRPSYYYHNSSNGEVTNIERQIQLDESEELRGDYLTKHSSDVFTEEPYEEPQKVGFFITTRFFPEGTKSVFHYRNPNHRHSRNGVIPSGNIDLFFDIEKEKVSELWKSGKVKDLMDHYVTFIEETEDYRRESYDPSIVREIYKRRKSTGTQRLDVYDPEVWRNEDELIQGRRGNVKIFNGLDLLSDESF